MTDNAYKRLAQRLDALPNGFPPTEDGAELRILETLFTPQEADLAAGLTLTLQTPQALSAPFNADPDQLGDQLKTMARAGLIRAGKTDDGLGYGLLPFVVGIYENQIGRLSPELAQKVEDYFQQAFSQALGVEPPFHRVIPVNQSIRNDMEVRPFESAVDILMGAQAWGVRDCICRVQKSLIGEACEHPVEVCMVISSYPNAFNNSPVDRALTLDEAVGILRFAADSGLVHSVSNSQEDVTYICNCCTCSCGILRGMANLGIANVIARSAFVNTVDEDICTGCELCLDACQFDALSIEEGMAQVNETRCIGCGVCVPNCLDGALYLARRPDEEIMDTPVTHQDWLSARAASRGLNMEGLL